MREQRRAYEEEQARIAAKHEAEAARRLEERRKADETRREEEVGRNGRWGLVGEEERSVLFGGAEDPGTEAVCPKK